MRRAFLLVFGLGAGGMMVFLLLGAVNTQRNGTQRNFLMQVDAFYPRSVMGTCLLAAETVRYDGPYWEDGSNEQVSGVAALVVENQGGLLVSGGAVIVEIGNERMVFEISFLPPGEKVLVLEKDRKPFSYQTPITCYGWTREEYPENPGLVSVESVGLGGLSLINHTGSAIPAIEVRYKNYDPEKGMFLGGISYCVIERELMPKESRLLNPVNFSTRGSRIVQIIQEMDR